MTIYVSRNNETLGPYTVDQTRDMLSKGMLLPMDLSWSEEESDWEPLYRRSNLFLQAKPAPTIEHPPQAPKSSVVTIQKTVKPRMGVWLRRIVGAFLVAFGAYGLIYGAAEQTGTWRLVGYVWASFLVLVGLRQLFGSTQQDREVSLKASFAVILGSLVLLCLPSVLALTLAAHGDKAARLAMLPFTAAGALAVFLGHRARRDIRENEALRGTVRAAIGMFGGYACLAVSCLAFVDANSFLKSSSEDQKAVSSEARAAATPTSQQFGADETKQILEGLREMKIENVKPLPSIPASYRGKRLVLADQMPGKEVESFSLQRAPILILTEDSLTMGDLTSPLVSVFTGDLQGTSRIIAVEQTRDIFVLWKADAKVTQAFPGGDCVLQWLGKKGAKLVLSAPKEDQQ